MRTENGAEEEVGPQMTAQERAALAIWLIAQQPQTTAAIAQRMGMTLEGARVMLMKISRTVPIFHNNGFWQICR